MRNEEERLFCELEAMQQEEAATLKAIAEQEAEAQRLAHEEERYWREYTRHRRDVIVTEDEYRR